MSEKQEKKIKKILAIMIRQSNDVALFLSVILVVIMAIFLYDNYFQSTKFIKTLGLLKNQVAINVIDMDTWQKINDKITEKKQPLDEWQNKYIPF